MFKKIGLVALLVAGPAGCAGMDYAMKNYSGVKVVTWVDPSTNAQWRIFDKPAENRMMITLGIGGAALQGAGQGITLGAADTRTPMILYQDGAIAWLASSGRHCSAAQTFLVIEPQYEVRYICR